MLVEGCIRVGSDRLVDANIQNPRREAQLLLAYSLNISTEKLISYPKIEVEDLSPYLKLIELRAAHVPYSRIIGIREFWSLDFNVTQNTFDPRPDSETIVESALDNVPNREQLVRVADLGTGTGCLLLAILHELPNAIGVGVDLNPETTMVAASNAFNLGLESRASFIAGDWGQALTGQFDLIVTNPPYIPTNTIFGLEPNVRCYDPKLALDGGADGLESYRLLLPDLPRLLTPNGTVVIEFGLSQVGGVCEMADDAGLKVLNVNNDLHGDERCIVCKSI